MPIQSSNGLLFDKIGGWLVFPAFIHPVIGVIANLQGAYDLSQSYSNPISANAKLFLVACFALSAAFAVAWIISAYLAGSLNRAFPAFYIALNVAGAVAPWLVIATVIYGFEVKPTSQDFQDAFKNVVGAIIWIPYMLVSKRVKATFYDVPMPSKLAFENVNSPLKQAALERQQARSDVHQDKEPLNMVQRIGMVLYWAGTGLAIIMALLALVGFANGPDKSFAIVMLVAAALSWLIGRALKYIFVGR